MAVSSTGSSWTAIAIAIAIACAACSSSQGSTPDAPAPPEAGPDAPAMFAACREFGATGQQLPVHVTGTLAGADLQSPTSCATVALFS